MRGRALNTTTHALAAILASALLTVSLAACGGGSTPSAETLLNDTFHSHQAIESGRVDLALALSGRGASQREAHPFALHVSGPFQSTNSAQLPRFDLALSLSASGHTLQAGATATGGAFYLTLAGTPFIAPPSTYEALQKGYAQASRRAGSAKSRSTFAALGIEPEGWLAHPVNAGSAQVAGTPTLHIVASLNVARFLADVDRLAGASGSLGLGGSSKQGLLSAGEISSLAASVRSARVDVYTGAQDHLLRRLTFLAALDATPGARAIMGPLRSGTLRLELQFAGLNEAQTIRAPRNPRPLGELVTQLQQLGVTG